MGVEKLLSPIHRGNPTRLETSLAAVGDLLNQGQAIEVFLALRRATTDTDLRVGHTETEDLNDISAERVRDYLAGLEEEEWALVEELSATNACDPEEIICVYEGWRTQLYVKIVNELGPLVVGSDTLVA